MKNFKVISATFLMILISIICCGCSGETNISVNKDGSGTFSCKYSISKTIYTNKTYTTVSSSKELVESIKKTAPKAVDLTFAVDTTSNKTYDYITVSFKFTSEKDLAKKLDVLGDTIASEEVAYVTLYETYEKCLASYDVTKSISISLEEYLKKNNIAYDTTSDNYKILLQELCKTEKASDSDDASYEILENEDGGFDSTPVISGTDAEDEDYDVDYDEDYDEDIALYKIITKDNKSTLQLYAGTIYNLEMYIAAAIINNLTTNFDQNKFITTFSNDLIEIDKKIFADVFDKIKLADKLKNISLGKATNTTTNNQTEIQNIFTKDFINAFTKEYEVATEKYVADSILAPLEAYNTSHLNSTYTINFLGKKLSFKLDNVDKYMDENGYISLSSNGSSSSNGEFDDSPKTADSSSYIVILLASISLLSLTFIVVKQKNKKSNMHL